MKVRFLVVAVLAAMLAIAATTASGGTSKAQAGKIVVWLQNDAQNGWPEAVALANRNFKAQHPDVDVDVQYQTWGNHLQKFDAGLAGGDAPDVIELGNTEMTKYMAAGAFKTLTQSVFPNNKTWLQGLKNSSQYNGKLYGVPYYAGARAVIYRKDQYKGAGIKSTPKSLAQFVADGKKLMKKYGKDSGYSAVYFPGKYWYYAMSFVYDYGGKIAVRSGGKWKGTLNSPRALAALNQVASIAKSLSRASKTTDEANPQQALVFSKGKVGSFVGNGWEWPYALDAKLGNPALDAGGRGLSDAEPHPGQVHAHVPRRLGSRRPGDDEESEPRRRLDQGVHEHRVGEPRSPRRATSPTRRSSSPSTRRTRSWRRSPARRSRAGSSPRARTGRTWRMRTCSRTCSSRSSPAGRR